MPRITVRPQKVSLLPCPCCGNKAQLDKRTCYGDYTPFSRYHTYCTKARCGLSTRDYSDVRLAQIHWNKRYKNRGKC